MSDENKQNSDKRFEMMEKIHQQYLPFYLSACRKNNLTSPVKRMIEDFVVGRLGRKKGVRAFIFDQMYRLAGGKEDISVLLAAVELQLAWMYCFNVGADRKTGYNTKNKIITAFKTAEIVHELALQTINRTQFSDVLKKEIEKVFLNTRKNFLEGEVQDTIINLYNNRGKTPKGVIKNIGRPSKKEVFNKYGLPKELIISYTNQLPDIPIRDFTFERTYKVNAIMFENFGEIIGLILNLNNKKVKGLKNYGKYFGISMQIINDVQDYSLDLSGEDGEVATREKNKKDVFNDIKNGLITWPIKISLDIDPSLDNLFKNKLGNKKLTYEELDGIRGSLVKNGTIKECILEAAYYSKLANESLKNFPNSEFKKVLCEESASMAKFSKYIYFLEKRYKVILRPSHSSINKRIKEKN